MPYMFQNLDPYDPRRKDQLRADFDAPAAGFGQMEYGEDYLPPPPPIQGAPVAPPKPPSALEQLQQINAKRPTIAEPAYKPKPLERILGGVAGAGLGFAEGYLNSGRRGPVVRPGTGAMVADAITNRRFNRAEREWNQEAEKAKGAADIEAQGRKQELDDLTKRSLVEDRKDRAVTRKYDSETRDLTRQQSLGQMNAEEVPEGAPTEQDEPGKQPMWTYFKVGGKTYRRPSEYAKKAAGEQAKRENYRALPPDVAKAFSIAPDEKVSPEEYKTFLNTHATLLDRAAARERDETLKRDLSAQADATRREIAAMSNETRRSVAVVAASSRGNQNDYRNTMSMARDFRQEQPVKSFSEVRDAFQRIQEAAKRNDGVGDLTLLRSFAKLTDPTTGVREEEYRSMQGAMGALQKMGVQLTEGMWNGQQLTPQGRKQFLDTARSLYSRHKGSYDKTINLYRKKAQAFGVDPDLVFAEIGAEESGAPPAPASGGKQLTPDIAKQFLERASGDKNKARELARAEGYAF
jgi:hypothetical protein